MLRSIPIAVGSIHVKGERLRPLDPALVDVLAESMKQDGLKVPILVRDIHPDHFSGYYLVAGMHRLEAARKLGWESIDCTLDDELDDTTARRAEIIENLKRGDLTREQRDDHIAALARSGFSSRRIAKEVNLHNTRVAAIIRERGVVDPGQQLIGVDGKNYGNRGDVTARNSAVACRRHLEQEAAPRPERPIPPPLSVWLQENYPQIYEEWRSL